MPTTQTTLFSPPQRDVAALPNGFLKWLLTLQQLFPFRAVDTTDGDYGEGTPPAGLNTATGQSNQNQEILYKKLSADGNTFTLTGTVDGPLPEGPLTLTAQYEYFRIRSNGTNWYVCT